LEQLKAKTTKVQPILPDKNSVMREAYAQSIDRPGLRKNGERCSYL